MADEIKAPQAPVTDTPSADTPTVELTDEQLSERIAKVSSEPVTEEQPAPAPEKETPVETPAPAKEELKVVEPEKVYAGKYKTVSDLSQATVELAKKLGIDEDLAKAFAESVKPEALEAKYKQMESQLGKRAQPAPVPPVQPQRISQDNLERGVAQLTLNQVRQSELAQEIRSLGLELPERWEQLDQFQEQLKGLDKATFFEFKRQFRDTSTENFRLAKEYANALAEQPVHNEQIQQQDIDEIRKVLKSNNMPDLSDEEAQAIMAEVKQSPYAYEKKNGVDYLRPQSVYQYWTATRLPQLLAQISLANLSKGRQQGVEDLTKLQQGAVQAPSTAALSSQAPAAKKDVDLTNEREVGGLGDDDIDDRIEKMAGGNTGPRLSRLKQLFGTRK